MGLALTLVVAAAGVGCGSTVVTTGSGATTGDPGASAGGTGASSSSSSTGPGVGSSCRTTQDCMSGDQFSEVACVFADPCLGPTQCPNYGDTQVACTMDTECDGGTYCRACGAGGAGFCAPSCDGGDCAPAPLQTCGSDSDCPAFCVNGYCAAYLGTCQNCT